LEKIKKASRDSLSFPQAFEEISKNGGISFLILDPSETQVQLLHHGHVIGGNWNAPAKKQVAILGSNFEAKPVQIIQKSIKNIKAKSFGFDEFLEVKDDAEKFLVLDNPTEDFQFKNILPITNSLTKIFIQLPSTSPFEVAKAFIEKSSELSIREATLNTSTTSNPDDPDSHSASETFSETGEKDEEKGEDSEPTSVLSPDDVVYAIQFCHLCATGKIPPVLYSLAPDPTISAWFKSISEGIRKTPDSNKRPTPTSPESESESEVSSPELKISKKDHYLINTMIKLHDTMDKSSKNKEDKEPGFKRLESHRKNLILNASAIPPFTKAASSPTEFYTAFLAKKSQFKAKDMLLHRFHADKIAFNPNSTVVTNLWNSEFFWILPDSPSGISIFYCPESKSSSSYELEKERSLALIDKVNAADIEKLAKQKISLPSSLMDLVWTTQNFHAVIALFWFGITFSLFYSNLDQSYLRQPTHILEYPGE
jgi:hypothetical protein